MIKALQSDNRANVVYPKEMRLGERAGVDASARSIADRIRGGGFDATSGEHEA